MSPKVKAATDLIDTEIVPAELYDGRADFAELWPHQARAGDALRGPYNLTHGRSDCLAWGDAIFISPRFNESLGQALRRGRHGLVRGHLS